MRARTNPPSPPEQPEPRWVSIQTAAETFAIHDWTVRQMIARGEAAAVRVGPRLIRVDLNTIARALRVVAGE
ncbi:excisionase family DNA-binding protein [Marisediminicola antarctica]|uniref:excisionase family DNA-binding protein n=1 Tax=Marisediminicola antarctica TaxID=674079 RepID=UPI00137AD1F2|nr:excisionase family DNA-binding protein [Marisediminicola antarctica]